MPSIAYGDQQIEYAIEEKPSLCSHYITVEKGVGVVLKGKPISEDIANKLVLKKARWILDKLELVRSIDVDDIVTGARMPYLGRKYYVELFINENLKGIEIDFTASKFKVSAPKELQQQEQLRSAFEQFFREKAKEKIPPRVRKWSKETGLAFHELKIRSLEKRWGSCTPSNNIIINTEAIKLPYQLIDYIIVHELAHTKVKNHSKEFWAEVAKHLPNWKELDKRMYREGGIWG